MKRQSHFLGFMCAAGLAAQFALAGTAAAGTAAVGEPAPDFQAVDTNGKPVKLSDYRGKTVVLEWTNHECPFVRKHYNADNMQGLQKTTTGDGAVWLTIVSSAEGEQGYVTPVEANKIIDEEKAAPTAKILDPKGDIGRAYGAQVTPHMYVVDAQGNLAYAGAIDDKPSTKVADVKTARPYLKEAYTAVTKGETPDPSLTRAYGCTIKYAS
ncbi:peroxiredoxin [Constrictibacter sp. MBR-5]|uniref:redoxin domain-containing protein n=1 Tax=Constrictibacter sp. MBR-5 TaxID=3156467 RepID=UPI003393B425